MEKAFEIMDHTADVGIIAYGASIEDLFSNSAMALFSLITELEDVEEKLRLDVEVSGEDTESLLVEWLNELIYLVDARHVLLKRFVIESLTERELHAVCYGDEFDPAKHKMKVGVKAATYHMLELAKSDGYSAQVIFDI